MKTSIALLLGGAAIGVAIGLLVAPKSGKETRADLKDKAGTFRNKFVSAVNQARQEGHMAGMAERT